MKFESVEEVAFPVLQQTRDPTSLLFAQCPQSKKTQNPIADILLLVFYLQQIHAKITSEKLTILMPRLLHFNVINVYKRYLLTIFKT